MDEGCMNIKHKEALMPLVLMHDNFPDCTRTHLNQFNVKIFHNNKSP